MIELGKIQNLQVKRFTSVGAYLNTEDGIDEDILLPKSQVPEEIEKGDFIEVMVYNDSKDRIIATTKKVKAQVGEMKKLQVVSQTKIGSFLDWGLEKDLFLPFAETIGSIERGKEYLVALYVDKSDRICATMKLQSFLTEDSPYAEDDIVEGTIYSINRDIGAFVAVNDKYNGLIPSKELIGAYDVGQKVTVRVRHVKEDGKLDLSLRDKGEKQMAEDVNDILDKLKRSNGFLPYNDKSNPEDIQREFGLSKGAFKRAVGHLYKERMIKIQEDGIKLL